MEVLLHVFFLFVYSAQEQKKKKPKHVENMLRAGEQQSQDSSWQQGHAIANYAFFSKCRQIAIVIMFSCNNDRYAYRRDNNDCRRQSSNTVEIFSLWGYADFGHTDISPKVQLSSGDPPVHCVSGKSVPVATGTQGGDCTWHGTCFPS